MPRRLPFLPPFLSFLSLAATLGSSAPAFAQVSESERAAARELFRAGDELQRGGRFAEALDKFQRAQQVFRAPTNLLRIAECEAALGRLVESAEAYREVVRTSLPSDAPPAFQAAVEQARAELAQVEPRVPRVVVQVQPANLPNAQLQVDGQPVPMALLGEPLSLDPGPHKIAVRAPGYTSVEEPAPLAEHETRTISITLKPLPPAPAPSPQAPAAPAPAPAPAPALAPTPALGPAPAPAPAPARSNRAVLLGAHLGGLFPGGNIPSASLPVPSASLGENVPMTTVAQGGFAYGVDGGIRFARQLYVGLELEHANMGNGSKLSLDVDGVSSNSTALDAVLGFIVDPDRPSFYVEVSAGVRWLHISETDASGPKSTTLGAGELGLGAGVWIPAGRNFAMLPKVSLSGGSFSGSSDSGSSSAQHVFVMVGVAGFFTTDF
jgi:hypothetical protein